LAYYHANRDLTESSLASEEKEAEMLEQQYMPDRNIQESLLFTENVILSVNRYGDCQILFRQYRRKKCTAIWFSYKNSVKIKI